jgi:predicted PhzF superfamily epimerase YddE/YHI9
MPTLHVVNVFTAPDGSEGNPLGVFLDGAEIPEAQRQAIAADLNFSETVFLDDRERAELEIYTPTHFIPFAGHPLVGTSWLLTHENTPRATLRPPAGEVHTWLEDGLTWIRGRAEWSPSFDFIQMDSADKVALLSSPPGDAIDGYCWAWEDEGRGRIRSRNFIPSLGVPEDPATGSAAVALAVKLGRSLQITQGNGCILKARLGPDGTAEVGGEVVLVETREYEVEASA